MYINDIHILYYFFIGLLGMCVGQFLDFANNKLQNHEHVICKEFFNEYIPNIKINFRNVIVMGAIYVALLYFIGWNVNLIKYLILSPMFVSAFIIDYREQIIPDRLTLTIFEVGCVFAFIQGFASINLFYDKLLGMCAGAGIFMLITLIGGLIAGKEAMGFGDVKLMGALGLIFGLTNIIMIAIMSFLLGAIISVMLLASKKKKSDEYIPFGPFIIMAAFIMVFVPHNIVLLVLLKTFSLGIYKE